MIFLLCPSGDPTNEIGPIPTMNFRPMLSVAALALTSVLLEAQQSSQPTTSNPTTPASQYAVVLITQPPPALPPSVTGQPKTLSKDIPPTLPLKPLPPGAQPSAETLQKIRSFQPPPEAVAKWKADHPAVPALPPAIAVKKASLGLPR